VKEETEKHNIRTHCVTCHGWKTHAHLGHTMQFVISHDIKPHFNTTTDKILIVLHYGHLWALQKVSEGKNSGESNTVSSSVGARRRGSFRKHYYVAYHNCCLIINSYACTGTQSSGMRNCVIVTVVPSVSKEYSAFISKGKAAHHILADFNSQQHHCENLKSRICLQFM
jgi:hypothetical protein